MLPAVDDELDALDSEAAAAESDEEKEARAEAEGAAA